MGYLAVWKVLDEMIADFRKRGVAPPTEVMNDLKSARTMIKISKADTNRGETAQKIEEYVGNVESYLISEGQKRFGTAYVDEWTRKLDEANRKMIDEEEEEVTFIPGIPREQKWIRVKPSAELPLEKLEKLAEESGLQCRVQNDGSVVVYGTDERVKGFVKKMTAKYGSKTRK